MTPKQQEQLNNMEKKSKCPHLNCLVYHPDGVCGCDMARWCSKCKGEFAPVSDEGKGHKCEEDIYGDCYTCGRSMLNDSTPPDEGKIYKNGLIGKLAGFVKGGKTYASLEEALSTPPESKWVRAKKLNLECPHGNYIGWCDNCPEEYCEYVQNWLASQKAERMEKIEKMRKRAECLPILKCDLCDKQRVYNQALDDVIKLLKE